MCGATRTPANGEPCGGSATEQAEYLRHRIDRLVDDLVVCRTALARVLERSARLRPHAAGRLQVAAARARLRAEDLSGRRARAGTSGE